MHWCKKDPKWHWSIKTSWQYFCFGVVHFNSTLSQPISGLPVDVVVIRWSATLHNLLLAVIWSNIQLYVFRFVFLAKFQWDKWKVTLPFVFYIADGWSGTCASWLWPFPHSVTEESTISLHCHKKSVYSVKDLSVLRVMALKSQGAWIYHR